MTGLEWIDYNNFVVVCLSGFANLFYLSHESSDGLKENFRFSDLHKFSFADGLSVFEKNVAVISEDGW